MITTGNMQLNLRMIKLIKKLETEPGFVREEDEKALYNALNEIGLTYVWNDSIYNPEIVVFQKTKRNLESITVFKNMSSEEDKINLRKEAGWKADTWGIRK